MAFASAPRLYSATALKAPGHRDGGGLGQRDSFLFECNQGIPVSGLTRRDPWDAPQKLVSGKLFLFW